MQTIEPDAFVCPTCGKNYFPYNNCGKIMCEQRLVNGEQFFERGTGYLKVRVRLGSYGPTLILNVPPYDTVNHLMSTIFDALILDKQPLPVNCKLFFLLRDEVIEAGPENNWNIQRFGLRNRDMIVVRFIDSGSTREVIWNPLYKTWMRPPKNGKLN